MTGDFIVQVLVNGQWVNEYNCGDQTDAEVVMHTIARYAIAGTPIRVVHIKYVASVTAGEVAR